MKRVIILGAGISGLSLGWFLKRRFGPRLSLRILEKSTRSGGWIRTKHHEGFLFEQGPRSCRSSGTGIETLKLIEQLGMQESVISADPSSCYRYLWTNKKLRRLPSGPFSFLFSSLTKGVIPACFRDLFTARSSIQDESIYSFIKRRFSRRVAEQLIDPLAAGIYAGNIKQLSIRSCFPLLYEWEKRQGSVLKGMIKCRKKPTHALSDFIRQIQKAGIFSMKDGLEELTNELGTRLDRHIIYASEVKKIHCTQNLASVELENGTIFEADHIYSTLPGGALSALFKNSHQELVRLLSEIPATSVATVNLGYHRKFLTKKGFGYLIPSGEKEKILGTVWDSSIFPKQNQIPEETRLTVMIGGAHINQFSDYSKSAFQDIAIAAMERHLGIQAEPNACLVNVAYQAIPQYLVGHAFRVSAIENILSRIFPKLTLHGNSFHGISVNDCIANSKRIEESIRTDELY